MRNPKVQLGVIFGITVLAILAVLPRTPITIKNKFVNIDTQIGGYVLDLFNGKFKLNLSKMKQGLDIEGGVKVVLKAEMDKIPDADKDRALESAKAVIVRRVDLLGVSEPVVATSKVGGEYRIIVELPGVTDVTEALKVVGQTAQLKFKQLKADLPYDQTKFQEYFVSKEVWDDSGVTGADLKGVDVVFSEAKVSDSGPQIKLRFTNEGRNKFSELAKKNINKPIAIFLDEDSFPISMPVVNPDLASGLTSDPVISGTFTVEEANRLSISLRAGALPVPVKVISQSNIGATLGQDSIRKSLIAGIVGVIIVSLFMAINYGRLGILADIALIIYGVVTLAVFKIVPVVITLPGIAGFILSVGMAVDANILIFERIKEEILWGKPFNLALKYGFERAWPSIRDSNFSSLITSAILFHFGTGIVRGFALTLAIGIFVSMFTAIFVTRNLVEVFYTRGKV